MIQLRRPFNALRHHLPRLKHQFGVPLTLGGTPYRVRGYCANRLATDHHHEPFLLKVLERNFAMRPGTFIDVGVNVGQTLIKVLALAPTRRYVGFEPQIGCAFFLDQFLKDNALEHAHVMPIALSNENCTVPLYFNQEYDEMASIAGALDTTGTARRLASFVPARVGDEVLGELGVTDAAIIKIDVEGAELLVLSGLKKTLATQRPFVIFEVLPNFYGDQRVRQTPELSAANTRTANDLYAFFDGIGYEIRQIDLDGNEKTITKFDLDDRQGYVGTNFLARPKNWA